SPTTVSIVLNNVALARYIPDKTKNRIHRAAKQLDYRPNLFARTLRNQRTHTVGVMVFDMTDPYCIPILRGIETTLYEASFLPILTDVHNERSRFERYLGMLLDRRVEALILVANWLFVDVDVLGDLEKSNVPSSVSTTSRIPASSPHPLQRCASRCRKWGKWPSTSLPTISTPFNSKVRSRPYIVSWSHNSFSAIPPAE